MVVAALLLAAACSGGSDTGRGGTPTAAARRQAATVPVTGASTGAPVDTTTPAPATTPTSGTAAAVADTAPTVTGTTAADTTDSTGTPTGTTSGPTPTTGSGPTVPTTLPTTDDTTTSTTEADTGDGTEPRNDVDRKYPLGSAERKAYLDASGGIAPAGATVTVDLGGTRSTSQHGRTTEDRYPNGFPAAPGSANYQATTLAQREAQRQARWVTLMDRSGIDHYWAVGVPWEPGQPFPDTEYLGAETPEMTLLRPYAAMEYVDGEWQFVLSDRPPAEAIWSHARWLICGDWKHTQRTDHTNTGTNTIPCEPVLDWALFAFEHFTRDADTRPAEQRAQVMWHHYDTALYVRPRPEVPAGVNPLVGDGPTETVRLTSLLKTVADEKGLLDSKVATRAFSAVWAYWDAETAAGRRPWEQAP